MKEHSELDSDDGEVLGLEAEAVGDDGGHCYLHTKHQCFPVFLLDAFHKRVLGYCSLGD